MMQRHSTDIPTTMSCDVLVVGAGPAGAIAARLLSLAGISVILLDTINLNRQKIGESLPGAALPMLQRLRLLTWLEKSEPLINKGNQSAWGKSQLQATDFIRDPYGCGWHLDRQRFDENLRLAAQESGALLVNGRLSSYCEVSDCIQARIGELTISTRWIMDASGKSNSVANLSNNSRRRDPPLFSIYTWCTNSNMDTRSIVEAVPTGWWYTAGLPDDQRILAFFTLPDIAQSMRRNKEDFSLAFENTTHIKRFCQLADAPQQSLQMTDATGSYLDNVFGSHWVAIGDAALSMDPLSSQGIYNAIYTGLRGAEAVEAALMKKDRSLLVQYGKRISSIRSAYREEVSKYYQQEQRWADNPFWVTHHSDRL